MLGYGNRVCFMFMAISKMLWFRQSGHSFLTLCQSFIFWLLFLLCNCSLSEPPRPLSGQFVMSLSFMHDAPWWRSMATQSPARTIQWTPRLRTLSRLLILELANKTASSVKNSSVDGGLFKSRLCEEYTIYCYCLANAPDTKTETCARWTTKLQLTQEVLNYKQAVINTSVRGQKWYRLPAWIMKTDMLTVFAIKAEIVCM